MGVSVRDVLRARGYAVCSPDAMDLQTRIEQSLHEAVAEMTRNELFPTMAGDEREKLKTLIASLQNTLKAVVDINR